MIAILSRQLANRLAAFGKVARGRVSRRRCRHPWSTFFAVFCLAMWSGALSAQQINIYFPPGITGYDQQLGVTVLTRAHPEYDPLGIKVGDFFIHPRLDQSLFYNSNVTATSGSGSWGSHTSAAASANSGWSRDSLSAAIGFDNYTFFSLPLENYTDWNVGLSGGYTIGDGQFVAAYSHQSYHQLGTTIGAVRSETPVLDQTDTGRIQYDFNIGRFTITPDLSASAYRFGTATVQGVSFSQTYLDNNVLAAGVTVRYSLGEEGGLLLVARDLRATYLNTPAGALRNDSNSVALLGGIDYQAKGLWRYRVLAGVEMRSFDTSQYGSHVAPDIEGSVIWTPTNLTTLTGTVASSIEAPQTAGTSGYTLSQVHLVLDEELRRNILLQGRGSAQYLQYLQGGGTQTGLAAGVGVTWLLSRDVKLSLDYNYSNLSGGSLAGRQSLQSQPTLQFDQSVLTLTLHLAL